MTVKATRHILRADAAYTALGGQVIDRPEIWVEGERIAWIGRQGERPAGDDCRVVDLSGHWLVPGFIDSHVHIFGVDFKDPAALLNVPLPLRTLVASQDLMKLLQIGVTAVRCVGNPIGPFLVRAIREKIVPGPHMITTGEHICRTGGPWDPIAWPAEWVESWNMLTDGVDECIKRVRERARQGCQLIKIGGSVGEHLDFSHAWGDNPYDEMAAYSDEEVKALVDEAHRNRMTVAVHAIGDAAVRQALRLGVDTIEHAHGSSEDTYRMIADQGVTVVPTLTLPAQRARFGAARGLAPHLVALWEKHLAIQFTSLELALKHGVKLAVGTDCIGPPHTPMDSNTYEMELMVEGGMTPEQVLEACYVQGREVMGLANDIGALDAGRFADIVALPGDPRRDIKRVREPRFVMKQGIVYRDEGGRVARTAAEQDGPEREADMLARLSAASFLADVEHKRAHVAGHEHVHLDGAGHGHAHHGHAHPHGHSHVAPTEGLSIEIYGRPH